MNSLQERIKTGRGLGFMGAPSALFAKLIERHGFDGIYLSGAALSMGVHGIPDDGTITLAQLSHFARLLCDATSLPVIADADTGFGDTNPGTGGETDIAPCIATLEVAGVAGVQIEDQVPAKKCGHLDGKQLEPLEVMVAKLHSAVEARRNADLVLIARTDARGVTGYDDALARAVAYRDAGADMIFIEALTDAEEFRRFAEDCPGPLLANMTEYGKSPLLERDQLAAWGYTVVIYPVTLLRLALHAADVALAALTAQGHQRGLLSAMWSRAQLYDLIGYDHAVPEPPPESASQPRRGPSAPSDD